MFHAEGHSRKRPGNTSCKTLTRLDSVAYRAERARIPDIEDDVSNNCDEEGVSSPAIKALELHPHALWSTKTSARSDNAPS